ncbi:hypothetical protein MRX96_033287 [Rhipicephalus microplus]
MINTRNGRPNHDFGSGDCGGNNDNPSTGMILCLFNWLLFSVELARLFVRLALASAESLYRTLVPKSRKDVSNSVVVVTGAARGLGREIACSFANLGAKVVLLDIDQARNNELAKTIPGIGREGILVRRTMEVNTLSHFWMIQEFPPQDA